MHYIVESSDGTHVTIQPCECCTNNTIWVQIGQTGLFNLEMGCHALALLRDQITKALAYHQDHNHIEDKHPPWEAKTVVDPGEHGYQDVSRRKKDRRHRRR